MIHVLQACWDLGPRLLIWFAHSFFYCSYPNTFCLNTSRGSTIGRQEGQSPCFHFRHLASQLPGATTWVLLSSCFSRYIIFIGNKSCGIQDAHTYWEGTEHETMPHHLNSKRFLPSLLTPFFHFFMRLISCRTANYDLQVKTLSVCWIPVTVACRGIKADQNSGSDRTLRHM